MTDLLKFIDASPSPYHAVEALRSILLQNGFVELSESSEWEFNNGKSYFTVRGGKTVAAWIVGSGGMAEGGFHICAAHTDSPTLKIKANPIRQSRNLTTLSIDLYGSALLHTWLDRDLKIVGAAYLRSAVSGVIERRILELTESPVRAMSLAPHLSERTKPVSLSVNPQTDLLMLFGNAESSGVSALVNQIASVCRSDVGAVCGYDLMLADVQPANVIGHKAEFLSASRIDNLFSCYCILQSLLCSRRSSHEHTNVGVWFDAEEIGSQTQTGARSNFLDALLHRIVSCCRNTSVQTFDRSKSRSFLVSADMAHAEHPCFPTRTDESHAPLLNEGVAVKLSSTGGYADCHALAAWFVGACKEGGVPLQTFVYRADHGGGSSVGPIASALTGIRSVDLGAPMLSMHSIREICGVRDVAHATAVMTMFYTEPIQLRE
jgi:aspartyl aminopeptidase